MIVDFSKINMHETPVLLLKNIEGQIIGVVPCKNDDSFDLKYNAVSTLEFIVPSHIDGVKNEIYDDINGMMTITAIGIGDFILNNPHETDDGVKKEKQCKAYSREYELTYKKITLPEGTYNFYDPLDMSLENPSDCKSVMGIVVRRYFPHWTIGDVDEKLIGKYRTFSVTGKNGYDFLMNTIQKSYNCLFVFDTESRTINVRNAETINEENNNSVAVKPVYISLNNLAKQIDIDEDTDNIFTCLDVNGADGVDIRDVNPTGTNKIYNFDYLIKNGKMSSDFQNKYNQWKDKLDICRQNYFNLSVEYAIYVEKKIAEDANLKTLQGELDAIQAQIDVHNEFISQYPDTADNNPEQKTDIDSLKTQKSEKEAEILAKKTTIEIIETEKDQVYNEILSIVNDCKIENNFIDDDYILFNKLIKEDTLSESSFVYRNTGSYTESSNNTLADKNIIIENSQGNLTTKISDDYTKNIYRFSGGQIKIDEVIDCEVNSMAVEHKTTQDGSATILLTAYLSSGHIYNEQFESACITITGAINGCSDDFSEENSISTGTSLTISNIQGSIYLTAKLSEYAKKSISWDLLEYGESVLSRISQPSYTFSVDSTNFFSIEEFRSFANSINLGDAIYLEIDEGKILIPIFIGAAIKYDSPDDLTLSFSDSFVGSDGTFKLIDLLDESVTMGKVVDAGKYTYSAFIDSGAKTAVDEFMNSALDVAKNAIINSYGQGMTWDKTGLRLRKYKDSSTTDFENEQIWMSNNSIMFTDDNWNTAKMAIGKYKDSYGIIAPYLVGNMIIGENLTIESKSPTDDTLLFRVDGNGVQIHNGDLSISSGSSTIALNPGFGLVIGNNDIYSFNEDGTKTLNTDNASFYIDSNGDLNIKGHINATSLTLGDEGDLEDLIASASKYGENLLIASTADVSFYSDEEILNCFKKYWVAPRSGWYDTGVTTYNGRRTFYHGTSTTKISDRGFSLPRINAFPNTKYTISFDIACDENHGDNIRLTLEHHDSYAKEDLEYTSDVKVNTKENVIADSPYINVVPSWKRVVKTFTTPENCKSFYIQFHNVSPNRDDWNYVSNIYITNIKIEQGDQATPYSLALYDPMIQNKVLDKSSVLRTDEKGKLIGVFDSNITIEDKDDDYSYVYFDNDDTSKYEVPKKGLIAADNAVIRGTIIATNGIFEGTVRATSFETIDCEIPKKSMEGYVGENLLIASTADYSYYSDEEILNCFKKYWVRSNSFDRVDVSDYLNKKTVRIKNKTDSGLTHYIARTDVIPNTTYTLSFDFAAEDYDSRVCIYAYYDCENHTNDVKYTDTLRDGSNNILEIKNFNSDWERKSVTFTTSEDWKSIYIGINTLSNDSEGYIYITNLKLEQGDTATPYSLAPNDPMNLSRVFGSNINIADNTTRTDAEYVDVWFDGNTDEVYTVLKEGLITVDNAIIKGTVIATKGVFGGLHIGEDEDKNTILKTSDGNIRFSTTFEIAGTEATIGIPFYCHGFGVGTVAGTTMLRLGINDQGKYKEEYGYSAIFRSYNTLEIRPDVDVPEGYKVTGSLKGTWTADTFTADVSDKNLKNSIDVLSDKYSLLFDELSPVTFKYNHSKSDRYHVGFISQDVEDALINAGLSTQDFGGVVITNEHEVDSKGNKILDENGDEIITHKHYLRYPEFIALNTSEIQKLKKRVAELEHTIKILKGE